MRIKTISDFPKEYGEDRNFIGDCIYGVIDGSSPIKIVEVKDFKTQQQCALNSAGFCIIG